MSRKDPSDKKPAGRQVVPTQQAAKRAAILESLRVGNTRRTACAVARVHHSTLYAWLREDPDFASAVGAAEAEAENDYVACIKDAMPKDWRAAAFWLERRRSNEWGRNETIHMVQRINQELDAMSNEELRRLAYGMEGCDELSDPVRAQERNAP